MTPLLFLYPGANMQQCLAVTLQYRFKKCLAVIYASGSHTAEVIAEHLRKVMNDWGVDNSMHRFVIIDSGANVKKGMSLVSKIHWRPCFAHTLQLVLGGLNHGDVSDLTKILAVGHFKRSTLSMYNLHKARRQLGLPKHCLHQDCSTRWNSQVSSSWYPDKFHLKNTDSIRLCQYYMCQLPVEMLIDMRKLLFWQKIRNSDCDLLRNFFGYCSAGLFDTLCNKYNLVIDRKLNRNKIVGNMYEIVRSNIVV